MMNNMARRCQFQSQNRGMKELNYLLNRFTEQAGETIWLDPLYQELMDYDDIWLWDAFMAPQSVSIPPRLEPLIEAIRSDHTSAHS